MTDYTKKGYIKKNCNNCEYLDWHEKESYESTDTSGFYCKNKDYNGDKEQQFLENLQQDDYREKSKKCCLRTPGLVCTMPIMISSKKGEVVFYEQEIPIKKVVNNVEIETKAQGENNE